MLGEDEDGDPITSLVFRHDPRVEPLMARKDTADRATTFCYTQAFLRVIQDMPAKTSLVADAMAREMAKDDETEGDFAARRKQIGTWFENLTRPKSKLQAPEVMACLVPNTSPKEWRKVATPTGGGGAP